MTDSEARRTLESWLSGLSLTLSTSQWHLLESYLQDVQEYNERTNVTADSGSTLWLRHVADGMAALWALRPALGSIPKPNLVDVGAGAGFVGIAVKVAWPEAEVTLNDSSRRKFQFLNWAAARLGLPGLHVAYGTAPRALGGKTFDAVLTRAVAPFEETLRLALPLVRPDGVLLAHQTAAPDTRAPAFRTMLEHAAARIEEIRTYRLPCETTDRCLVLIRPNTQQGE